LLLHPWASPLKGDELYRYWEAMPLTSMPYPTAISFVIGSFPSLFGTATGARLREWCASQGWLLVWSLGLNTQDPQNFWSIGAETTPFPSNRRLLDPMTLAASTASANHSFGPTSWSAFDDSWKQVNRTRTLHPFGRGLTNRSWLSLWEETSTNATAVLQLFPRRAVSCADLERCVGTDMEGHCVCYSA